MRHLFSTITMLALATACGSETSSSGAGGSGAGGSGAGGSGASGGSGPALPSVAECAAVCEDALANQCVELTNTTCDECCDIGLSISECASEAAAFHACASSVNDPCQVDCDAETSALVECLTNYCAESGDEQCGTLIGCRAPMGAGGSGGA